MYPVGIGLHPDPTFIQKTYAWILSLGLCAVYLFAQILTYSLPVYKSYQTFRTGMKTTLYEDYPNPHKEMGILF